jgi:hypothetical protein
MVTFNILHYKVLHSIFHLFFPLPPSLVEDLVPIPILNGFMVTIMPPYRDCAILHVSWLVYQTVTETGTPDLIPKVCRLCHMAEEANLNDARKHLDG